MLFIVRSFHSRVRSFSVRAGLFAFASEKKLYMSMEMHLKIFLLALVLAALVSHSLSEKPRKLKKFKDDKKFWNLQEKLQRLQKAEAELESELEEELEDEIDSDAGSVSDIIDFSSFRDYEDDAEEDVVYPCEDIFCGPGKECVINDKGEGVCQCVDRCENVADVRRKVCSNHNQTWSSDCELYRMRCLCSEGSQECKDKKLEHLHIDYYGQCQEVPECEDEEMEDFPRRMREWLFNIMRDMADRKELSEHFLEMEKKAEEDERMKWVNSAVWKWCELDSHPKDRSVSRHELFPVLAPLYTLEHCIAPFLNSCDSDDDHYITLKEWTKCLELSEDNAEDLEDLCEDIRD